MQTHCTDSDRELENIFKGSTTICKHIWRTILVSSTWNRSEASLPESLSVPFAHCLAFCFSELFALVSQIEDLNAAWRQVYAIISSVNMVYSFHQSGYEMEMILSGIGRLYKCGYSKDELGNLVSQIPFEMWNIYMDYIEEMYIQHWQLQS